MAHYQLTDLMFDYDEHRPDPDPAEQAVGSIWEADDDDDLVEEITAAYGWCVLSVDYRLILA